MLVNPAWNWGVKASEFDRVMVINDDILFYP
jgi:hypothetical protein